MAIPFTLHKRMDPTDPGAPCKFYPVAKSTGEVNLKGLSASIAAITNLNEAEAMDMLTALMEILCKTAVSGQIINLDGFGTFSLALSGRGELKAEAITPFSVHTASIVFRPGNELNRMMQVLKFERSPG